jgi:hypothetical protein
MAAADKRDGWRFNSIQFIRVFVWHMLGMPESNYSAVKGRLKCWLIAGFSLATASIPLLFIQHAIWLYLRFTLSYRDIEDLLAERGLDISYETVRRWVLKFGPIV